MIWLIPMWFTDEKGDVSFKELQTGSHQYFELSKLKMVWNIFNFL